MVASASGAGVRLYPSALDGEAAPFGAASTASSLASAPPCRFHARFARPAVAIGRAYRSMVVVVARPHVVPGVEFWRPGDRSWSPVRSALRHVRSSRSSSESFEVVQAGFFPPTAGRSLIGGTSACFGLATAVLHCCGWVTLGYGWSPVLPSFGRGGLRQLLYP